MTTASVLAILAMALPAVAIAQEFAAPTSRATLGPGALLERALPNGATGASLATLLTRWPLAMTARSLIAGGAFRGVAAEAGVASAGDDALGWNAAGLALGIADRVAGAAARAVVRRDHESPVELPAVGVETGMGGWMSLGPMRIWASAPQAFLAGESPPLPRGLTAGVEWAAGGVALGLEREAPRQGIVEPAAHAARLSLALAGITAWTELRDQPLRGGVGIEATVGALRVASQVDGHPVLAPTVRMSLALERRRPDS